MSYQLVLCWEVFSLYERCLFVLRFTRRCISVAPSRETAGELLLGTTLSISPSCSMHNIVSQSQSTQSNVLSLRHWRILLCLLVIQWGKLLFVLLLVHQISLTLCCRTGKSGMYFVEDNAADAHDNQVKSQRTIQDYSAICEPARLLNTGMCLCVWTEPSRGDRGAFFLLDVRGDQGGAQALVAAKRQRCGDIPHQRQDTPVSLWQLQGEATTWNKSQGIKMKEAIKK